MDDHSITDSDESEVRQLLEQWARSTREGRLEQILEHHAPDVLIYDVLAPMKYESAAAYRRSWSDWQPDTQGDANFELQNLAVVAGGGVAFGHCFIHCGGTLPDGKIFEDLVRATFCLQKTEGVWKVTHQHISKPFPAGGNE